MEEKDKLVIQNGRIFYIEPNDVYGKNEYNVVPYEDLCISFNLTCEVYDRQGIKANNGSFALSFETGDVKYQNFLQGMGKHNSEFTLPGDDVSTFLTTYYTDISSGNNDKQLIESLGVESINISYENYYAPRVQIKFIDVRGEALFGMEESIHNEAGKIKGENVFGAFFTYPYPKFRLQIKGFYGRPVTFQLACESFKGNFNASNGNFEANVTFIGYQYSLMTDIPMRYLIAAPLQEYYGKEYWDKNADSDRWRLSDGTKPMTLFEFCNLVRTAIMDKEQKKGGLSPEEEAKLTQLSAFKGMYTSLEQACKEFARTLTDSEANGGAVHIVTDSDNAANCKQMILMYSAGEKPSNANSGSDFTIGFGIDTNTKEGEITINFNEKITKSHDNLITLLNEFNASVHTGDVKTKISESDYINGKNELWGDKKTNLVRKCISKIADSNGKISVHMTNDNYVTNGYYSGLEKLDSGYTVNGVSLNEKIRTELKKFLINEENLENIGEYWIAIDFKTLPDILSREINLCTEEQDRIENSPSEKNEIDYTQVLGFKPTIGNIYKMVMCHLETLCHIMFSVGNQVDSKHRTPESTGISIAQTDVASTNPNEETTYGPFPGVMNNGTSSTENGDAERDEAFVRAWVGDIMNSKGEHPFEDEANLVRGFIRATQSVYVGLNKEADYVISGKRVVDNIPILPFDEMDGYNEFIPIENTNNDNAYISTLAGQLGFRMSNIFGIFNGGNNIGGDSRLYGEIDALNYYMSLKDVEKLSEHIIGNGGDNLSRRLENIMLCNSEGQEYTSVSKSGGNDKRHAFETDMLSDEHSQTNRHPMFKVNNGKYIYCHYYDEDGKSLVPSYLASDFSYYSSPSAGSKKTRFRCVTKKDGETKRVTTYFEPYLDETSGNNYYDGYNFLYATSDLPKTQEIEGEYKSEYYINTRMFDIDMPDYKTAVNKVDSYNRFIQENNIEAYDYTADISKYQNLYKKHWKMDRNAYNASFQGKGADMYRENMSSNMKNASLQRQYFNEEDTKCKNDCFGDNVGREPYMTKFIHELNVNGNESIFMNEIYYLQNSIKDTALRNRCKFLLLLHTLKYERPNSNNWWFRNKSKKYGTIETLPLGQVLLFGGLLWRQREANDPIITSNGQGVTCYIGDKNYTLFDNNGIFRIAKDRGCKYIKIADYFGVDINTLDLRYQNRLVKFFLDFADNNFVGCFDSLEVRDDNNRTIDAAKIVKIKTDLKNKLVKDKWWETKDRTGVIDYLREETNIFKKGKHCYYDELVDNYLAINFDKHTQNFRLLINDDDNHAGIQDNLRVLYASEVFVYDGVGKFTTVGDSTGGNGIISISESDFRGYLDGFADMLRKIHDKKKGVSMNREDEREITLNPESYTKEMAIDIYYYLKNLWDKWLIVHHRGNDNSMGSSEFGQDYFNVERFFDENFIFVDKFYVNMSDLLLCNAEKVADAIKDIFGNRDANMFSFLSQICSDHGCMLFAMPDFIDFGDNITEGSEALIDAFKAYPYEKIGKPREENKFVIMYADQPSSVATDKTGHRTDSFDIRPVADGSNTPAAFKNVSLKPTDDNPTVYGYGVPAFGVSFGRQKQSIFKNINVNMNNPMMTSVSIQATTDLANTAKDSGRKVFFQGQDLFSIYSNYSYECEVEMMGNAQIMPLMYFQLMNVPLWRGAYMIFKVEHSITPGNMTTKFVGQKMSKVSTPWCTTSVVKAKDTLGIDDAGENTNSGRTERANENVKPKETMYEPRMDESMYDGVIPCEGYIGYPDNPNPTDEYLESLRKNLYIESGNIVIGRHALRCDLAKMYLAIRDEYEKACDNNYTVCITSAVRGANSGVYKSGSEHNGPDSNKKYHSNAIDLNIADPVKHKQNGKKYIEIFRLMDVIIDNHFNDIGQLILEAKKDKYYNCFTDGTGLYKDKTMGYNCLHLSCGNKTAASKYDGNKEHPEIYVSDGDFKSYKFTKVETAQKNCAPEFLEIAGKYYWKLGFKTFKLCFNNFIYMTESQMNELFAPYKTGAEDSTSMYDVTDEASKYGVDDTPAFHEVVKYLGLPFANGVGEVVRDNKTKYPVINDSGRAKLTDKSKGMNGCSLVTNVAMDLKLNPAPSFSIESCRATYGVAISKGDLKAGDIIIMEKKDVFLYLGKGKVAVVDNSNGVAIIDFKENTKYKYDYRRHGKNEVPVPTGGDVESKLWRMLTQDLHFTPEGAAGFMGNVKYESGMDPKALYGTKAGSTEREQYTQDAMRMTKNEFADNKAYGLCQWTKNRKGELYDLTIDKGLSPANEDAQLQMIKNELSKTYYATPLKKLTSSDSIYDSTMRVLVSYERPKYIDCEKSFGRRYEIAKAYYKQFMGNDKMNDPQNLYYTQNGEYAKLVE